MNFLRHILRLLSVLLFSAFGMNMALAVPMVISDINYSQIEITHIAKGDDVGFAARAPPMAMSNVAVTGGVNVMHGGAFALHGQETVAALFGFGADHIATNRARTQQLSDAQRQLDDLSASLQGQRNPPATAIGAVDPQTGRVVTATSGDIPATIHPQLQQMADDLGGIGVRTGCGNVLGRCAEFRAANDLLLGNPNLNLSDIGFTPAVRPRTGQIIPRCENCVNVFGVE